jgi:hypothetical protein
MPSCDATHPTLKDGRHKLRCDLPAGHDGPHTSAPFAHKTRAPVKFDADGHPTKFEDRTEQAVHQWTGGDA